MKNWLIKLLGGYLKEDVYAASGRNATLRVKARAKGQQEILATLYAMAEQQQPIGLAPPTGDPDDMIILTVDEFANDIGEVTVH